MPSLQDRIQHHADALSRSDRAVLDVLLSHPTEAAYLPADQVAARANVHVAGATRLAKKLGYRGYPDLRRSLQTELFGGVSPAERVRHRLAHMSESDVLGTLVNDEIAALTAAVQAVSQAELDAVAQRILDARRIMLYARGNASILAAMAARRLRRFGLDALVLGTDGRDLAEALVPLGAGDLVLACAFRRRGKSLVGLLATAREVGAASVLITDTVHTQLPEQPDAVLAAPRGSGREYQSLTVPMAVLNSLVLTVARVGSARTMPSLRRLEVLLERFDSDE